VLDARSIYRPVATVPSPVIHSVSVCPIGAALERSEEIGCESRAVIGPWDRTMYVTPTDAWLWTNQDGWSDDDEDAEDEDGCGAAWLYRLPLSGARAGVARVRGEPIDQLSLAAIGGRLHALTRHAGCGAGNLSFATIDFSRVGRRLAEVPASAYVTVPDPGGAIENRFTDTHLVYGSRSHAGSRPPEEAPENGQIAIVPVARPEAAELIAIPHSVIRAERAGSDIVLTGYRDERGLDVSLVDLAGRPRIASTVTLEGRYETEGRSHAFNSAIGADGNGLLGLPTSPKIRESDRWVFRSGPSDLSYLRVTADGRLAPLGELQRSGTAPRPDYRCEVSCIDWYGNSRPIFTGGRVFALTGTEIIEGQVAGERISETRRLDLTAPVPARP
jgi:hypothetical protein